VTGGKGGRRREGTLQSGHLDPRPVRRPQANGITADKARRGNNSYINAARSRAQIADLPAARNAVNWQLPRDDPDVARRQHGALIATDQPQARWPCIERKPFRILAIFATTLPIPLISSSCVMPACRAPGSVPRKPLHARGNRWKAASHTEPCQ
jgi:hypothetical protein